VSRSWRVHLGCVVGALVALAPPAHADEAAPAPAARAEDAATRFDRGVQLYKEKSYEAALVEFRRAHQLSPNFRVLYNLGQACYQVRDYACALESFEKYLADGGADVPADRRDEVTKELAQLEPLVAKVTIEAPAGTEISVDDVPRGRAPLPKPLVLNAGRHRVAGRLEGHAPAQRGVELATSDRSTVALELVPLQTSPPPTETAPRVEPKPTKAPQKPVDTGTPSSSRPPLWIGWVASGTLAAAGAVTGVLALGASSRLADDRERIPVDKTTLDDDRDRAARLALVTDVLLGAAVVVGGATLVLTLSSGSGERSASRHDVRARFGTSGVALTGSF